MQTAGGSNRSAGPFCLLSPLAALLELGVPPPDPAADSGPAQNMRVSV
ncbi:hypothetical protein [Novosphingobium sp. B 225]|nr:hypothetical protein [Novosphingobium sp. B 225]